MVKKGEIQKKLYTLHLHVNHLGVRYVNAFFVCAQKSSPPPSKYSFY